MTRDWHKTIKDPRLPKASLIWFKWHRFWFTDMWLALRGRGIWRLRELLWLKSRCANASILTVGPLLIGWRSAWLVGPARAYHPEIFND